jgi:dipeptidyl aminopeptidase/acylaminoacyl peptidase
MVRALFKGAGGMKKIDYSDYYQMRYVSSPHMDVGTGRIAYTLTIPHPYEYEQKVIVIAPETRTEQTVTAGGKQEEYPRFSPDGTKLAFISDASDERQIWLYGLGDGTLLQLTHMRYGVTSFVWSPDGKALSFLSPCVPGEDEALLQTPETKEEKEKREHIESTQPVVIEDYGYKSDDDMGFTKKTVSHLWVVSVDGGTAKRLTDGDREHVMPAWSPDSKTLIFASNRCRAREESIAMDLFSVPVEGGGMTRMTDDVWIAWYPKAFQPLFTPDGRWIIIGALEPAGPGNMPATRLYRLPAEGGKAVSIWPEDAPCYEATCFVYNAENIGSFTETAQVSEDGRYVYFLSGWAGSCNIYRARIEDKPEIIQVTWDKACWRGLCPPAGGKALGVRGSFTNTPQLYLLELDTGDAVQQTDTNPWLKERQLSRAEELWIDTLDGNGRVHGFILPPQEKEPGKKYPTILYIHGGPTPFYGYALTYEYQLLAARGFGIILCNPRGTGGYGAEHAELMQAFDGTAMTDLLQFVNEAVRACAWIDGEKIGVTGASYGGYMTNWLITHTRRFRAAVTQRSFCNHLIQYASSDMAGSSRDYNDFADFMKDQIKKSPVAYADRVNIPLLMLHSFGDMRCPVEQAHQWYTAVKDTHPELPVRMVLFPDSNHSLTMSGPMHLRIAHYKETADWFERYLR